MRKTKRNITIGRRAMGALAKEAPKGATYFDTELRGFGVRYSAAGAASWIVEYRPGAGGRNVAKRRVVIGHPDTLSPEKAREAAKALLARIELGADPAAERQAARRAETVSELFDAYMKEHVRAKKKASTADNYDSIFDVHLKPALGKRAANSIAKKDVSRLHRKIGEDQPARANRVLSLVSSMWGWAISNDVLPEGYPNPARGIKMFDETPRERYLSIAESAALGDALILAETSGIPWAPDPEKKSKHAPKEENRLVAFDQWAVAAIRLLIFTGCRMREILNLRWSEVDLERGFLFLPDSKTGKKTVTLNAPAREILANLERAGIYVIASESAGRDDEKPRSDLNRPWRRICAHAGLKDFRLHDLRHSFASIGAGGGHGLPVIGRLLGHKNVITTQRYAHLADDPLRRAADSIGAEIKARLEGKANNVTPLIGGAG